MLKKIILVSCDFHKYLLHFSSVLDVRKISFEEQTFSELKLGLIKYFEQSLQPWLTFSSQVLAMKCSRVMLLLQLDLVSAILVRLFSLKPTALPRWPRFM